MMISYGIDSPCSPAQNGGIFALLRQAAGNHPDGKGSIYFESLTTPAVRLVDEPLGHELEAEWLKSSRYQ